LTNFQLFYCQNQEKICNNTVTKDHTTPQILYILYAGSLHYLVKCQRFKETIENKTTSVTTHYKSVVQQQGGHIELKGVTVTLDNN